MCKNKLFFFLLMLCLIYQLYKKNHKSLLYKKKLLHCKHFLNKIFLYFKRVLCHPRRNQRLLPVSRILHVKLYF